MLARCSPSLASRLLPGRFAFVATRSRESAACSASDISALLLRQQHDRGSEEADRKDHKYEHIQPEIGKGQSFGEGTNADLLEPGRWKHQADHLPLAGEGGHGDEQTGKVHDRDDGENRGSKDCRYLGLGEGRDELPETARGKHVEQSPEREGCERSLDRNVENDER